MTVEGEDRVAAAGIEGAARRPVHDVIERLSIEVTRACTKGCSFCYNGSNIDGATSWTVGELLALVRDCADHGTAAVSFGGGEPLQFAGILELLAGLRGRLFRSVTTNGLLLDAAMSELVDVGPDKIHVSIHFPDRRAEVDRAIRQVNALADAGISSGVNLLVRHSGLAAAAAARQRLVEAGIGPERTVLLPMRGTDTPTPREMAQVAAARSFQSVTCLAACGGSPRFASIDWARRIAWCSYTTERRELASLDHRGVVDALGGLRIAFCGTVVGAPAGRAP